MIAGLKSCGLSFWIDNHNRLIAGEVLVFTGRHSVESVAGNYGVVKGSIRDATKSAVNVVARTIIDRNKEGLVWLKGGVRGGNIAGFCNHAAADGKQVSYGGQVKKTWSAGGVESVGLAGIALVDIADIASGVWLGLGIVLIKGEEEGEEKCCSGRDGVVCVFHFCLVMGEFAYKNEISIVFVFWRSAL